MAHDASSNRPENRIQSPNPVPEAEASSDPGAIPVGQPTDRTDPGAVPSAAAVPSADPNAGASSEPGHALFPASGADREAAAGPSPSLAEGSDLSEPASPVPGASAAPASGATSSSDPHPAPGADPGIDPGAAPGAAGAAAGASASNSAEAPGPAGPASAFGDEARNAEGSVLNTGGHGHGAANPAAGGAVSGAEGAGSPKTEGGAEKADPVPNSSAGAGNSAGSGLFSDPKGGAEKSAPAEKNRDSAAAGAAAPEETAENSQKSGVTGDKAADEPKKPGLFDENVDPNLTPRQRIARRVIAQRKDDGPLFPGPKKKTKPAPPAENPLFTSRDMSDRSAQELAIHHRQQDLKYREQKRREKAYREQEEAEEEAKRLADDNAGSAEPTELIELRSHYDDKHERSEVNPEWTKKTERFYRDLAHSLLRSAQHRLADRVTNHTEARLTADDICAVTSVKMGDPSISSTYRIQLRVAANFAMTLIEADPDEVIDAMEILYKLGDEDDPATRTKDDPKHKGVAARTKRFRKDHFEKILIYNQGYAARSKYAQDLCKFMIATIDTGLRPSEWEYATLVETKDEERNGVFLYILNGKATHGRALGLDRTLNVTGLPLETRHAIAHTIEQAQKYADQEAYDKWIKGMRDALTSSCITLFGEDPKKSARYQLYSLRHQCIANWKDRYERHEVSALCGHISLETAVQHYGRRSSSWNTDNVPMVMPTDRDIAKMKHAISLKENEEKRIREVGPKHLSTRSRKKKKKPL